MERNAGRIRGSILGGRRRAWRVRKQRRRTWYGVKYRLMGFDAPETFQAKCDAELGLGKRAAERLKELLASGEDRIVESGKIDRYGRTLAHVTVNGRDVGGVLIGEGLARAYDGRTRRESWCG